MLARIKNLRDAVRVIHDMNKVPRSLRPGQELEIDLLPRHVRNYLAEAAKPGSKIKVKQIDDWPDEPQPEPKARRGMVTNVRQAQTLAEVGGMRGPTMRQRPHPEAPPEQGDEIDPQAPNDASGTVYIEEENKPENTQGNPIAHNAQQQAQPPQPEEPPAEEPATATQMLAWLEVTPCSEQDMLRIANAVLPKDTLPQRPKKAQILAALRKQAKVEADEEGE